MVDSPGSPKAETRAVSSRRPVSGIPASAGRDDWTAGAARVHTGSRGRYVDLADRGLREERRLTALEADGGGGTPGRWTALAPYQRISRAADVSRRNPGRCGGDRRSAECRGRAPDPEGRGRPMA